MLKKRDVIKVWGLISGGDARDIMHLGVAARADSHNKLV